MPETCGNCNQELKGPFCSNCGQRNNTNRISLRQILQDIFNFMFNLDSPIWRTLRMAIVSPGKLSRDYINGKRRTYFHPVRYFLVALAVYYLFVWMFDFNPVKVTFENMGEGENYDVDSQDLTIRMSNIIRKNVNLLMFVWIILISLSDKLFYAKTPYNIAERSIHYFFALGTYSLLYSPFIALTLVDVSPDIIRLICLVLFIPYTVMSFHKKKGVLHAIKALLHVVLSFFVYVISISAAILSYLLLFET